MPLLTQGGACGIIRAMKAKSIVFVVFAQCALAGVLLVGCSQYRCGETVKASSFGFDPEDSTRFLQAALDSDASEIVVDKMPSAWVTTPLKGTSNKRIVFEDGVELVAKKGAFLGGGDHVMDFINCSNVTLTGRATLRMNKADYLKPPYQKSEHRHALNFYGCRDVLIEGLAIVESGGDGIYVGHGNGPCRNFVLRGVTCINNRRQAISGISVDGLLIDRCTFKDTSGTPPAAGIDFEPNRGDQSIRNVTMRESVFDCARESPPTPARRKTMPMSVTMTTVTIRSSISVNPRSLDLSFFTVEPFNL